MTSDIHALTVAEAGRAIRIGKLSIVEYTTALVSRAEKFDQNLGCFTLLCGDQAVDRAHRLERSHKKQDVGPLFGIPFAVKDNIDVAGLPTTCQSSAKVTDLAADNADVVQFLTDAGAICIGKTSLDEFALGAPDALHGWYPPRNPWNLSATAGGSSSGSAVALAAGFVPLALGTDTGGSIRNPAMMCGVVGLKPGHGRVSMNGVYPLAPTMDVVGPMTRTVEDAFLSFECLNGGTSASFQALERPPRLARVGIGFQDSVGLAEPVAMSFEHALRDIEGARGTVVECVLPPLAEFNSAGWTTLYYEAFQVHEVGLRDHSDQYGSDTRQALLRSAKISRSEYRKAQQQRKALSDAIDYILDSNDAVILPVSAQPTCEDLDHKSLRIVASATGHPAISLPMGMSVDGLPIGMQVVGRKMGERDLLSVSAWIESQMSGWTRGRQPDLNQTLTANQSGTQLNFVSERANAFESRSEPLG